MTPDAAGFYAQWPGSMMRAKSMAPDIGKAFPPFFAALMRDGALGARQKELIALGIAVATHCEPCIYSHAQKCLGSGASSAEIMEAAGVGVMMGGGPAYTAVPIVAAAIEHLEGRTAPVGA